MFLKFIVKILEKAHNTSQKKKNCKFNSLYFFSTRLSG